MLQSVIARGHLNMIQDKAKLVPVFINFSAQTNSQSTQVMIESKLEKKRKTILGKQEAERVGVIFVNFGGTENILSVDMLFSNIHVTIIIVYVH